MATAIAQPDRSAKQRVFQAPEKKPPSSGHAITSIRANSGLHTHEKVRVSPGVQHSVSNQAMQRFLKHGALQTKLATGHLGNAAAKDTAFGRGQDAPETPAGRRFMAHDLMPVVRQNTRVGGIVRRAPAPPDAAVGPGVRVGRTSRGPAGADFDGQFPLRIEVTGVPGNCNGLSWEQFIGGAFDLADDRGKTVSIDACKEIKAHVNAKSRRWSVVR